MVDTSSYARSVSGLDGIPRDYEELRHEFGRLIISTVGRMAVKAKGDVDEAVSHIWVKLLEARVIEKYWERAAVPRTVTALEAAAFLGISYGQWRTAMYSFFVGCKVRGKNGKWRTDPETGQDFRAHGHWMPKPINAAEFDAKGLKGGYSSKVAVFDFEDVVKLSMEGFFLKVGVMQMPAVIATRLHFQHYLMRAVNNHWLNFQRTKFRRHKERPGDDLCAAGKSDEGEAFDWTASLEDPHAASQVEALTLLSQVRHSLVQAIGEEKEKEVYGHLESGLTLSEALRRVSLPRGVEEKVLERVQGLS